MKTRKRFTSEFKAKVSIEALKEESSLSELSKKYELSQNQISKWKSEFISKASLIFDKKTKKEKEKFPAKSDLYTKIGKLEVENDFLKHALSKI